MKRVVLIGPMGAGKTAIGRRLARKLDWDFIDTDQEIQRRTGVDIAFVFEKEGEAGFRERESRVIAELTDAGRCVVSTGGGAVLREDNREALRRNAVVVFLSASVDTQLERTRKGKHRPLLDEPDPEGILAGLQEKRLPLYRETATLEMETDGQHVEEVARKLLQLLKREFPETFND